MLRWPSLSLSNMPSYRVISLTTRFVATKIRCSDRVFMVGFGVVYVSLLYCRIFLCKLRKYFFFFFGILQLFYNNWISLLFFKKK
jgi:hypothetical protein